MSVVADRLGFWQPRKVRLLEQSEAAECGVACLGMVAGYFGHHASLGELRRRFSVTMAGTTLADLVDYAARLGLAARPLRLGVEQVRAVALPAILHWDLNHFVVLARTGRRGYLILDPAAGERWVAREELSRRFTGIALELTPAAGFEPKAPGAGLGLRDFCRNMVGLRRSLALVFGLSALLQVFVVAGPYYMQLVVDDVLMTSDTNLLVVLALGFSLVLLFEVAADFLRGLATLHLGSVMGVQMTLNLFHHLVRLPLDFFQKRHMGDIVSRFGSLQQVKDLVARGLVEALIDGLMAIAVVVVLFVYSRQLATVVLLAALAYVGIRLALYGSLREVSRQEIVARAAENSNFMETVRGVQTIKLFGAEARREGAWLELLLEATNRKIRLGLFNASYRGINRTLFGLENIVVVYLAARMVLSGGFSVGMLIAFMAYKTQFIGKCTALVDRLIEFRMLSLHFERVADIAMEPAEHAWPRAMVQHRVGGGISLQEVSFRYGDGDPPLLERLSLDVAPGEFVALVGPSGCGKTTVMKLMLGLLEPSAGEVLVDGVPLRQVGHGQYRAQIAAVMQDDQLLSGSVAENIAFFDERIDMERVVACARAASIDAPVRAMAMGYNSLIGDMGSSLSGGQKQRLLLARALYRRPRILFLDEATSHLDAATEACINSALGGMDTTRVVIAHRIETIRAADRVVDLSMLHAAPEGRAGHSPRETVTVDMA